MVKLLLIITLKLQKYWKLIEVFELKKCGIKQNPNMFSLATTIKVFAHGPFTSNILNYIIILTAT